MRVVSDFLDRLAIRAIGGDSMLSPRLPSLFEPAVNAGGPAIAEAPGQVQSVQKEPAVEDAPLRLDRSGEKTAPVDIPARLSPRLSVQADVVLAREERVADANAQPPMIVGNKSETRGALETPRLPTIDRQVSRDVETVVRERHIIHVQEIVRPASEEPLGVLLPPRAPIFATAQADVSRPGASGHRPATIRAAERQPVSGEPVVHVSIGRLEVRAAATTGVAAPKRQEGPRPGSMDDYLRQRGGQGS